MKKKIFSYLGFAKKAGKLVTGTNTCMFTAKQGRLKLMIISEDTADGSAKKLIKAADDNNVTWRIYGNCEELSRITGSSLRNVFGITDVNFAEVILKEIDGE